MSRTEGLDQFARDVVRRHAHRLSRRRGFAHQDRADLEHSLTAQLLRSLPHFDPARGGWPAFVETLVRNAAARLARDRHAQKRADGNTGSLHARRSGEEHQHDPADRGAEAAHRLTDLALDLAEVLDRLPPDLREVLELLKTHTLSEVARRLGVPRTTLTGRVRALRERFEQAGLRDYL